MQKIDMMGQPCPIPVVRAKEALCVPGARGVEVRVDNITAAQNLEKMANGRGYVYSCVQLNESEWCVILHVQGAQPVSALPDETAATAEGGGLTVVITCKEMGTGAQELGEILMKGYIFTLSQLQILPQNVIFLNSGAHLTLEGAATLLDLQLLASRGTQIYTCGTCLNYYGITEKLAVGEIVNMMDISSCIAAAGRVITL